jgi:hypothetical protein
MKRIMIITLLLSLVLVVGCSQTKYVCSDGTAVSDSSQCITECNVKYGIFCDDQNGKHEIEIENFCDGEIVSKRYFSCETNLCEEKVEHYTNCAETINPTKCVNGLYCKAVDVLPPT